MPDAVWAEAPEDPEEAFLHIALSAYERLKTLERDEAARGEHHFSAWRRQYIHELCTIADQFGIAGLPSVSQAESANEGNFDTLLARVITRIRAAKRLDLRADTVVLSMHTKADIRQHLEELRSKINSSNLSDDVRSALHKKVDAVEAELEHQRTSLRPLWVLSGALTAACAAVSGTADLPAAIKNFNEVLSIVHHEKATEELASRRLREGPLISNEPRLQITDQSGGSEVQE
ncbi:hypothetical protein [Sphingomonas arenae]|uniref:hypothetical protein n=1 Tax=Sphingomonas arenae TaxID=2812555 RepID=UPI0019686599|nr:hypothetical protein [Sphingomonas arenae]